MSAVSSMPLKVQYQFSQLIKLAFSIGLFLMVSTGLYGQQTSQKGWFDADFNFGCRSLTITMTHTGVNTSDLQFNFEGDPNDPFSLNFPNTPAGNSGTFSNGETRTFTYTTPGTYIIRVVDQSSTGSNQDRFDFLTITVLDKFSPSVAARICSNNEVRLFFDYAFDPFESFDIDYGDGTPIENFVKDVNANNGSTPHTYAVNGVYDITITGIFSAGGNNSDCNSVTIRVSTLETIVPPVLNSIVVVDQTNITFEYDPLMDGLLYFLEIDKGNGFEAFSDLDPLLNPTSITVEDLSLDNNQQTYDFRIRATDICASIQAISLIGSSIASNFSLNNIETTIDIDYTWSTSPAGFTQIDFFINGTLGSTFNEPSSTTPHTISHTNCAQLLPFFFQTVTNGIVSTSQTLTPFANSTLVLPATDAAQGELVGGSIRLTLPSTNFLLGEYQILRRDVNPTFSQIATTALSTFVDTTIPQGTAEACYQIRYVDECGNISALSAEVCVIIEAKLGIPTAFTPNGDNINDFFSVTDGIYNDFQMLIYNRWGSLVFQTNSPTPGWNGMFEGTEAPSGSYSYRITFQNTDNSRVNRSGTFVLIR
ncbi:gliding motility-associated C-terminal domain-containing protein [Roseivirga sp. E12]|uniref:T9SS type B sorting domain-containing protein n=1 Tax=Roseivirga sp. E12 TaxID=2819237 RepID=UPI001ABC06E3|nr:gliding motility-associated C-terminal domain-containing protein [Roseivirga sp. E12]MBO3697983.1 gliding motility-associated C-terminal domain-containing protein [Roseivirga sp. E12]